MYQRIDQAGYKLPIDERFLTDTDTLMVLGLDHLVSEQEAEQGKRMPAMLTLWQAPSQEALADHNDNKSQPIRPNPWLLLAG
jgi:hypothetical protein